MQSQEAREKSPTLGISEEAVGYGDEGESSEKENSKTGKLSRGYSLRA